MKNSLDLFQEEYAEIQAIYAKLIHAVTKSKALDAKTKHLMYLAMKIITNDKNAITYHIPLAKKEGASRDEIKETIALSITVVGSKGISSFLKEALETYDNHKI